MQALCAHSFCLGFKNSENKYQSRALSEVISLFSWSYAIIIFLSAAK